MPESNLNPDDLMAASMRRIAHNLAAGTPPKDECFEYRVCTSPDPLPPLRLSSDMLGMLETLQAYIHAGNVASGWWNDLTTGADLRGVRVVECLALIHSEVSEATEAYRRGKMDDHLPHRLGIEVELADIVLRVFDLAGSMNLDLPGALVAKYNYNRTRPDHSLHARRAAGGKKF